MDTWLRYFHVILNVLFILVGLVLIAFGVYVLVGSPSHELLTYVSGNRVLIYGAIALGAVVFLVGACGALGSCYQNKCLLMTYLTINVIFLLAQLALVIFVLVEKDSMKEHLKSVWQELNNETKFLLQDNFDCCGYITQEEWGGNFPKSCFNSTVIEGEDKTLWSETCYDKVVEYFDENIILAGAIAGLVFLLEAFQMVVTCFLVRDIDEKRSYRHSATRNNNEDFDSEGAFEDYMKNQAYEESRR